MVPSTGDPDAAGYAERANKAKKVVKISARSLGKLDRNEVMKTAAKARASSSVFRPIDAHRGHESDVISSGKASIRSSTSIGYSGPKESNNETRLSPLQNSYPQSLANQDDYDTGTPTASSLSCPVHIHKLAPHSQLPPTAHPPAPVRPASGIQRAPVPTTQISNPKCSIQLHLMFGTTEKPLLSGIKRLVGTCQCLLKREQDLELSCLQETHVSWRIQAVSLATM
jgi:palmitoyltransferase ZDHHC1/11